MHEIRYERVNPIQIHIDTVAPMEQDDSSSMSLSPLPSPSADMQMEQLKTLLQQQQQKKQQKLLQQQLHSTIAPLQSTIAVPRATTATQYPARGPVFERAMAISCAPPIAPVLERGTAGGVARGPVALLRLHDHMTETRQRHQWPRGALPSTQHGLLLSPGKRR